MRHTGAVALLLLLSHTGFALDIQPPDSTEATSALYDSRLQLTFGLFLPSINSTAQLNTQTGRVGTIVNLEAAFKLPETQNLFRLNGLYRFNNSHSVEGYYYALNRSGYSASRDSIVFGKVVINVNSTVSSFFDATLFGVKYRYSIYDRENFEAGFSLGLSFLDIGVGADVYLLDKEVGNEEYSVLLPLPVVGFFNRVNITEHFIFRSNVDMFALNIGTYDGILFDLGISMEYLFLKLFGIGVSYNVFSLDVKFDTNESGRITYSHRGLMFYAKLTF